MGDKSGIEWTNATWNPLRGCRRVSEGCRHCYAERIAARFSGLGQPYEGLATRTQLGPRWTGNVRLLPELLDQPLYWAKPRRIFVNSMSDLFHEDVPADFIWDVFAVMAACPQHTFQVLTKRPARMQAMLRLPGSVHKLDTACDALAVRQGWCHADNWQWPLANVWLGVSVEDQAAADERIPLLLRTPAGVRWVSAEPLLGPINLAQAHKAYMDGKWYEPDDQPNRLDWVVVGGESGPGARPMHPDWARRIRDDCQRAGVPFFFKQWGGWMPRSEIADDVRFLLVVRGKSWGCLDIEGKFYPETTPWNGRQNDPDHNHEVTVYRIGKSAAGRLLDGREWNEYPAQA